jgi:hypothetical protein
MERHVIEEKLLRLERMPHADKINHWGGKSPWKIDGANLKLPFKSTAFPAGHIQMDDRGNITRSPWLVNRPCFGQVTAFLRHGGNGHVFCPKTGGYQPDRCSRCPVAKACAFVCEKRLSCTPAIQELYLEWKHRGGRSSSWPKSGKPGSASVTLRRLLDVLRKHPFTSDNDDRVQKYYEGLINERRLKERERKRVERVKVAIENARHGELSQELKQVLNAQCVWRSERYKELQRHPSAPLSLRKGRGDTVMFDSLVWLARTRIELRGGRPNPSNCARELHVLGLEHARNHNALRDKTGRSLRRIGLLESISMPDNLNGDRVWPRFTIKHLHASVTQCTLQGSASVVLNEPQPITLQNSSSAADEGSGQPIHPAEKAAVLL